MKELKDRDNLDLFGLVCELSGRYALWNTETLHDAFFEAKNELEKRIKALENDQGLRQELQTLKDAVKHDIKINTVDRLKPNWIEEYNESKSKLETLIK